MKVRVLWFGQLRESRGLAEEWVDWPESTTVAELFERQMGHRATGVAFAVDQTLVDGATTPTDGAEVAYLPPVGGG